MKKLLVQYTGTIFSLDRGIEDRTDVGNDRERGEKEAGAPAHKDIPVNGEAAGNGSRIG